MFTFVKGKTAFYEQLCYIYAIHNFLKYLNQWLFVYLFNICLDWEIFAAKSFSPFYLGTLLISELRVLCVVLKASPVLSPCSSDTGLPMKVASAP